MLVKLGLKNFGYFAFNPRSSLLSKQDQDRALALTIFMGIFTLGIGPAICGIVFSAQKKQLSLDLANIRNVAHDKLGSKKTDNSQATTKISGNSSSNLMNQVPRKEEHSLQQNPSLQVEAPSEILSPKSVESLNTDIIAEIFVNLSLDTRAELLSNEQLKILKMKIEKDYIEYGISLDLTKNVLSGNKLSTGYGMFGDTSEAKKLWKTINIMQSRGLCGKTTQEKAQWLALHYACGLICSRVLNPMGKILFEALVNYARDGLDASLSVENRQDILYALMEVFAINHPLILCVQRGEPITSRQIFSIVSDRTEEVFNFDRGLIAPWENIKAFIKQEAFS